MSSQKSSEAVLYSERVRPNFSSFLVALVPLPAVTLVSEPFDVRIGLVIGSILVVAIWLALIMGAPVIRVSRTSLRVGRATISREFLGKIQEIAKDEIFQERGPNLDPASYKVFQGTVKTALKIFIKDPLDPTPYWIISTRKPSQLATVLKAKV